MAAARALLALFLAVVLVLAQPAAGARLLLQGNRAVALTTGSRGSGSSQAARSSIAATNTQQAIRAAARGDISAHSATRVGAVNAHVASSNPWAPWPTFGWMPLYYGRR